MKQKPIILIVDDAPKNIQVLGTLLAKFDCELAVALNGQQALDTVKKIKPDLILLDVMMPIMDGYETCNHLKNDDSTKDIPIIFLSAKTETDDIVKGFELGAVDYITKPFIGKELLARVKTHLALNNAQRIVKEEVETKNKFFSIMSHDLRGAFGIIMSFVELIQVNREYLTQDEIDELLNDIAKTSKNTMSLLEDLLKWARAQTGAIKFNPKRLKLQELFSKVCDTQQDIAQAKEIQLTSTAGDDQIIFGDSNMVRLIIRNLIANSIKFTNKGGKITVSAEDHGNFIKTSVTDTGVGIKKETISKLFSIQSKVSTSGTDNETGNGLGLVLCKEFVKVNGGKIGIESTLGVGTTVWFTLPKNSSTD